MEDTVATAAIKEAVASFAAATAATGTALDAGSGARRVKLGRGGFVT